MTAMAIEAPQDKTFVDRAESLGAFLRPLRTGSTGLLYLYRLMNHIQRKSSHSFIIHEIPARMMSIKNNSMYYPKKRLVASIQRNRPS